MSESDKLAPPSEGVAPFFERHPILKQAFADASRLSWQQVGVPALGALANFIVSLYRDWEAGRLDMSLSGKNLLWSLLIGVALYAVIAVLRAPFVVIARTHQRVTCLDQRLLTIESTASAVVTSPPPAPLMLESLERLYELKKLEGNIVQGDAEDVIAYTDGNGVIVSGVEAESTKGFQALVVPYFNRSPERRVAPVEKVSARITYRYFDNHQPLMVHRGHWLGEKETEIDFSPNGPPRRLILATLEEKTVNAIRRDFESYQGTATKREPLHGTLLRVHVELVTASQPIPLKEFEYMLEVVGEATICLRITDAQLWKLRHLLDFEINGHRLRNECYKVEIEAHEKGEAIGDYSDAEILAEKKTKLEAIAERAKEWEMRAAKFLGLHIESRLKQEFPALTPTLEQGLNNTPRGAFVMAMKRSGGNYLSPNFSLGDAIDVRTEKLGEQNNRLR